MNGKKTEEIRPHRLKSGKILGFRFSYSALFLPSFLKNLFLPHPWGGATAQNIYPWSFLWCFCSFYRIGVPGFHGIELTDTRLLRAILLVLFVNFCTDRKTWMLVCWNLIFIFPIHSFFLGDSIFEFSLELLSAISEIAQNPRAPPLRIDVKSSFQSKFFLFVKGNLRFSVIS